jgi:hypothetical protein
MKRSGKRRTRKRVAREQQEKVKLHLREESSS